MVKKGKGRGRPSKKVVESSDRTSDSDYHYPNRYKSTAAGNDDNGSTGRHQQSLNPIPSSPATPHLDHIFSQTRRYLTRSLLAQSEARTSRYPIRNVKGIASPSSSLTPPRTGLFETTPASHKFNLGVAPEPKVRMSAADFSRAPMIDGSSGDLPPTSSDFAEIDKFAVDYLDPHQGSNPVIPPPPPTAADEVAPEFSMRPRDVNGNQTEGSCVNGNEQSKSLARSSSLNYTMIAEMIETSGDEVDSAVDPALVTVRGYRVKDEVAPLLRSIFQKYGDIAKDCSVESMKLRSMLLEIVCAIYLDLEKRSLVKRKPTDVSRFEIENMLAEVADLQATKVEVGWLRQRLEDILEAVRETSRYTALKDEKARKILKAEILAKELEESRKRTLRLESEMAAIQAEVKESDEALVNSKGKMNLFKRPLVVNLL